MDATQAAKEPPKREEAFLAQIGAYGWGDVRGRLGSVGRLIETDELVCLPVQPAVPSIDLSTKLSLAHVTALRFLWHDLAALVDLDDLPGTFPNHIYPVHAEFRLANLRTDPFSLASVYGKTNVAGDLSRTLERAQRWPWESERMWLGYMGRDLLRLTSAVWDDRAPLSEDFFDGLPPHLRSRFWQDGDLAGCLAVVPEPRNDTSLLLSQFHASVLARHNAFVAESETDRRCPFDTENLFRDARLKNRHSFHATVLLEVIPRICKPDSVSVALLHRAKHYQERSDQLGCRFLPIEAVVLFNLLLSGAAPAQFFPNMQQFLAGKPLQQNQFESKTNGLPLNLMASPRIPMHLASQYFIDWAFVLNTEIGETGPALPLPSYLHGIPVASGQTAARALGVPVLSPAEVAKILNQTVTDASALSDYFVAEARALAKTSRLGPLGSIILAETLVGLQGGKMSYLFNAPHRQLDTFLGTTKVRS